MKKFWETIKKLFGWKPKVVPTPVNNFADWSFIEKEIAVMLNLVRENRKPDSVIKIITGSFSPTKSIPELIPNKLCWEEARKRCEVQFTKEVISHEGVGEAFYVIRKEGYESPAEVLASGYSTPESVIKAWFKSLRHRLIILSPSYKYFGVAQAEHEGRKYYCILFCS